MKKFRILTLGLIFCCILTGLWGISKVYAATTTATLAITNSVPTVSNITITNEDAGAVALTAGTHIDFQLKFTVTDNNSCEDIDSGSNDTSAVFYRTNVASGIACTPDNANCYALTCTQDALSCTAGGADLAATYTCTSEVNFFADATDAGTYSTTTWTAGIIAADNAGAATANTTKTTEITSLFAHTITASIQYDALALGANTGTTDQTTTVANKGNRVMDVQAGGYGDTTGDDFAMACDIGNIAVASEKYSLAAATAYASKTAMQADDNPLTISTFDLATGASSSKAIYWGIAVPVSGVGGSCNGVIVTTSVASA